MTTSHSARPLRRSLAAGVALALATIPLTSSAPVFAGTTITVTTTSDELDVDGNCSLREAVLSANLDEAVDACQAGAGADTIALPPGFYVLAIGGRGESDGLTGDLDITGDVTID